MVGLDHLLNIWFEESVIHIIYNGLIVISLIFVLIVAGKTYHRNKKLRDEKDKLSALSVKLKEREELFRTIYEQSPIGISIVNDEYRILNVNHMYEKIVGRTKEEICAFGWEKFTHPDDLQDDMELFNKFKSGEIEGYSMMKRYLKPDGSTVWVNMTIASLKDNNQSDLNHIVLIEDITERKRKEEEIQYLNHHDFLTGLYNRRFFDKERERLDRKEQLPLSVITGDLDGLKLINDAFGHAAGDTLIIEAAKIIHSCCQGKGIVARTGGDEFFILLPQTDCHEVLAIIKEIKDKCNHYNQSIDNQIFYINISLGFSTKEVMGKDIEQVIKEAEDYMYKRKLIDHKNFHRAMISSIRRKLFDKSQETELHSERIAILSSLVGQKLNLSQLELYKLELLGALHDIGKVGVEGNILNKPDRLIDEEWLEMRKHPEIGYRIAMSSPELVHIAEYILSHHEHWNGQGYPRGLKGEEIPLLSRILGVVDAYDAMTQDRSYRKAMKKEKAIAEIRKNAGIQFDPRIVEIFLDQVLEEAEELLIEKHRGIIEDVS